MVTDGVLSSKLKSRASVRSQVYTRDEYHDNKDVSALLMMKLDPWICNKQVALLPHYGGAISDLSAWINDTVARVQGSKRDPLNSTVKSYVIPVVFSNHWTTLIYHPPMKGKDAKLVYIDSSPGQNNSNAMHRFNKIKEIATKLGVEDSRRIIIGGVQEGAKRCGDWMVTNAMHYIDSYSRSKSFSMSDLFLARGCGYNPQGCKTLQKNILQHHVQLLNQRWDGRLSWRYNGYINRLMRSWVATAQGVRKVT